MPKNAQIAKSRRITKYHKNSQKIKKHRKKSKKTWKNMEKYTKLIANRKNKKQKIEVKDGH